MKSEIRGRLECAAKAATTLGMAEACERGIRSRIHDLEEDVELIASAVSNLALMVSRLIRPSERGSAPQI
jgi:hypothetical protein